MCVPCYIDANLPTKVTDIGWIFADSYERRKEAGEKKNPSFDESLAKSIKRESISIEKEKKTISIVTENGKLTIPITVEDIDHLAQKIGILVGKWLIYRMSSEVDSAWKIIAENTWNGDLGISAKVSTSLQKGRRHVICVYTYNYLDLIDVKWVREKLRTLGFNEELCYKPDIHTHLGIYYRATSLSPCRYRM